VSRTQTGPGAHEGFGPIGIVVLACVLALAPTQSFQVRAPAGAAVRAAAGPVGLALRTQLAHPAGEDNAFASIYRERSYRPLWLAGLHPRPEAYALADLLRHADDDGLDPAAYDADRLSAALSRARSAPPEDLARLELALSRAYARYAVDVREAPRSAQLLITDPELRSPPLTPREALQAAARAPSLSRRLDTLRPRNPVYEGLRTALADYRKTRPSGAAPDAYERQLQINLARARALPPDREARFVLVDAASAQLWVFENGQVRQAMPVAVGKITQPTPLMAGMIRYAVFQPYWNVPADLARDTFAPKVLSQGTGYLAAQRMEVLSDWSDTPQVVDPATVDWAAVAAGQQTVRLRQTPGPSNMMGAVKLMLPNSLGVYLHDTPDRSVFSRAERNFSAGCVRLFNAMALARLLGAPPPSHEGPPEQRVDLPQPTPVYIAYFTAMPQGGRIALAHDPYNRDAPLLAELADRPAARRTEVAAR
jgi:murein L,D-transpeptidase YcbB/YkuD